MINKDLKRLRRICNEYELIENYNEAIADTEKKWVLHHKKELVATGGERFMKAEELKALGLYFNLPKEDLIFLRKDIHDAMHKKECSVSDETRKKQSEAKKGKEFSKEHRMHLAEKKFGNTNAKGSIRGDDYKEKQKTSHLGKKKGWIWIHNNYINVQIMKGTAIPRGFELGYNHSL